MRIVISEEANRAIRGASVGAFRQAGERLPDGTWSIPVQSDTYDRLMDSRFNGESVSDAIIRMIAYAGGRIA